MARPESSWAAALLSLAATPAEAGRFGAVLSSLAQAMETSAPLRAFLLDPTLPRAAQKDVLVRLAPKKAPKTVLNCLRLLVDKGRVALLPGIAAEYQRRSAVRGGACLVTVHSAAPLDEAEAKRIGNLFALRAGATGAVVKTHVDPALVGGVRVQVGDVLYDESLRGRMDGLRRAIQARIAGN